MPRLATKVALSIPKDLYASIERIRRKSGRSRSAVMQEALRSWLRQQQETTLVQQYEVGYRTKPETQREIATAEAAAVATLSSQEW